MRRIVIVSERLAYLGDIVVADYREMAPAAAGEAMDRFAAKYRAGGWTVVDARSLAPAA